MESLIVRGSLYKCQEKKGKYVYISKKHNQLFKEKPRHTLPSYYASQFKYIFFKCKTFFSETYPYTKYISYLLKPT